MSTEVMKDIIGAGLAPTRMRLNSSDASIARKTLENTPLPTSRVEAWKYTRVSKLGKINFSNEKATVESIDRYLIDSKALTLVFINGNYSSELSSENTINGLSINELSTVNEINSSVTLENEIFNALNTIHMTGGAEIKISSKAKISTPVQIIHILKGDDQISNFRIKIVAEQFSEAEFVLGYFSENATNSFCNSIVEFDVATNSKVTIDKIQYESDANFHISTEQINQAKDSTFTLNTITLNGGLVRNNVNVNVNGENCESNLNGAYLLKGKQHVDNHTVIDHRVPHCNSNELYKGVIDDNSTAVFNGKVYVREDAQKINAFQSNGNVLLSDSGTINSKPELEIYADDVKCSHGSTTGQLDEEAIFYLRARGISANSARKLMVSAFVGDVLEKIENESVKEFIDSKLLERFGWDL